jgi:hypothetical protein
LQGAEIAYKNDDDEQQEELHQTAFSVFSHELQHFEYPLCYF